MNRKNKKNKNKPSNPVPPQKSDEKVDPNPEVEEPAEKRVPEIISDVVNPETKDSDNDSPKKPKRNRGKKKTNDQDNEPEDEQKDENQAATEQPVAPANRKKKNKSKSSDAVPEIPLKETPVTQIPSEMTETQKSPEPGEDKPKKKNKKNKKRSDSERSEKAEELSCTAAFQKILLPPEPKPDKKEAKIDEPVQESKKNINVKKDESQKQEPAKQETKPLDANVKKAIPVPPPPPPQEFLTRIQPVAEKSETGDGFEEHKGKKKKKDKKYPEQQDLITALILGEAKVDVKPVLFAKNLDTRKTVEKKDQGKDSDKNKETAKDQQTLKEKMISTEDEQKKNTVKKQVKNEKETKKTEEKNLKKCGDEGKDTDKNKETTKEQASLKEKIISTEEKQKQNIDKKQEIIKKGTEETEEKCLKEKEQTIKQCEIREEAIEKDVILPSAPIPQDKKLKTDVKSEEKTELDASNKSKAKIAKPVEKKVKSKQNVEAPHPVVAAESKVEEVKSEPKLDINVQIVKKCIENVGTEVKKRESTVTHSTKPISVKLDVDTGSSEIKKTTDKKQAEKQPTADQIIEKILSESISMEDKMVASALLEDKKKTLSTEKLHHPDADQKNKKSPKAQRKSGKNPESKPITPEPADTKPQDTADKQKTTETIESKIPSPVTEKTFAPIPDEISLSDIEKDVSITPDITPDQIEHPMASSLQLMDPNNNTVIQEIATSTLGVQVLIPDTPFVTSPEEPLKVDIPTGSKVMEEKNKGLKEEKTDLKSKVLEVNKDMEELRLSIEKSLAEFTSLEKDEINRQKKDDLIIVTCAEVKTKVKTEPVIIDTVKTEVKAEPLKMDTSKSEVKAEPLKMDTVKTEVKAEPIKIDTTKLTKIDEIQEKTTEIQGDIIKTKEIPIEAPENKIQIPEPSDVPIPPQRKDNKGKGKSKKKGKQDVAQEQTTTSLATTTTQESKTSTLETNTEEKNDKKGKIDAKEDGKKQADADNDKKDSEKTVDKNKASETKDSIENFEESLTSSVEDVKKTFEIIANECKDEENLEKDKQENQQTNPVSQPKNLLGHTDIPVPSNKTDYKKERNKTPNTKQARVKIKDAVEIEKSNKESQTFGKPKYGRNKSINESVTCVTNENEEYVYKYSFRKVFLSNICHVCKKDLRDSRVPCNFCYLIFYCCEKHKEEDVAQHSGLCFAISTIAHLKGQKHIYAETAGVTGHSYRLLRMQAIVSAEKILKRRLEPWEQEALLYPRLCADGGCREWRQGLLSDCPACGQISFCSSNPDHITKTHARWCKSYSLYQKLVIHQLTVGRLDPRLPSKVLTQSRITDNINRLLADMYDEKIDMNDIQYASLTQLATAPLTAAYCYQLYRTKMDAVTNGVQMAKYLTIHVVGAELQFEADSLNKWETFFLHLKPDVDVLNVVLIGPELNPSNLPLDLLGKIKLCARCRVERRRVSLHFHDQLYHNYCRSDNYLAPDIVCVFNPSIHRSTNYIRNDTWSGTINCILQTKKPFLLTSYTMTELQRDIATVKKCAEDPFNFVSEPKFNPFASVRPDRNFISDDEIPLLFKNYCYAVLIGAF